MFDKTVQNNIVDIHKGSYCRSIDKCLRFDRAKESTDSLISKYIGHIQLI